MFVTARYTFVDAGVSLLKPTTPGVISAVVDIPVVTTSAITPEPGSGSVTSSLLASAVLLAASV